MEDEDYDDLPVATSGYLEVINSDDEEESEVEQKHRSLISKIISLIRCVLPSGQSKKVRTERVKRTFPSLSDKKKERLEILELTAKQQLVFLQYLNTKGLRYNDHTYILDRGVFWEFLTIGCWIFQPSMFTSVEHTNLWLLQEDPNYCHVMEDHPISLDECHLLCLHDNFRLRGISSSQFDGIQTHTYPNLFPIFEYELSRSSIPECQITSDYIRFTKARDPLRSGVLRKYLHRVAEGSYRYRGSEKIRNDLLIREIGRNRRP